MATRIEGYTVVLTGKGLERFRREYRDQFMVVKHKYDAERGEYPGKYNDANNNFSHGSKWVSGDGKYFVCVDPTPEKAKWLQIEAELSTESYNEEDVEEAESHDQEIETEDLLDQEETTDNLPKEEEDDQTDLYQKSMEYKEKLKKEKKKGIDIDTGDNAPAEKIKVGSIPKKNLYKEEIPDEVPYKNRLTEDNKVQNLGHLVEHIKNGTLKELKHINEKRAKAIKEVVRKYQ